MCTLAKLLGGDFKEIISDIGLCKVYRMQTSRTYYNFKSRLIGVALLSIADSINANNFHFDKWTKVIIYSLNTELLNGA